MRFIRKRKNMKSYSFSYSLTYGIFLYSLTRANGFYGQIKDYVQYIHTSAGYE